MVMHFKNAESISRLKPSSTYILAFWLWTRHWGPVPLLGKGHVAWVQRVQQNCCTHATFLSAPPALLGPCSNCRADVFQHPHFVGHCL
jgi:hypothetical protein